MSKEYYADKTRLSASMCKALLRSPAHAYKQLHDPDPPTPQMEFGKAFHLYMERQDINDFLIHDGKTKTSKGFKELKLQAEEDSKIALLDSEIEQIGYMFTAINSHNTAGYLLNSITDYEHKIEWDLTLIDGKVVKCKSLIDGIFFNEDKVVISDWKTTSNASPDELPLQMYKYGYHIQAAFYIDAIKYIKGDIPIDFYFVFVEKEAPYGVSVVKCSTGLEEEDWFLKIGKREYLRAAQLWVDCHKTNKWCGYGDEPIKATLPGWAINKHRIVK